MPAKLMSPFVVSRTQHLSSRGTTRGLKIGLPGFIWRMACQNIPKDEAIPKTSHPNCSYGALSPGPCASTERGGCR